MPEPPENTYKAGTQAWCIMQKAVELEAHRKPVLMDDILEGAQKMFQDANKGAKVHSACLRSLLRRFYSIKNDLLALTPAWEFVAPLDEDGKYQKGFVVLQPRSRRQGDFPF